MASYSDDLGKASSKKVVGSIKKKKIYTGAQKKAKAKGALMGSPFGLLPAGLSALLSGRGKNDYFDITASGQGEGRYYDTVNQGKGALAGLLGGSLGVPGAKQKSGLDLLLEQLTGGGDKLGRPNLPGVNYGQTAADLARAKNLVGLEYDARESGVQRAMKQEKTNYNRLLSDLNEALTKETTAQTEFGKGADVKLQEIYGALKGELEGNLAKTQDIFAKGTEGVKSAYGEAGQVQDASAAKINEALQKRAEGLGIEAATPEALANLVAEQQGAVSRTAESGAAAQGNLITAGAEEAGVQQRGIAGSQREAAQQRADMALSVSDALANIRIQGLQGKRELTRGLQDSLTELGGQLADLRGERGAALREAVLQVTEARSDKERQRRLDTLAEHIQLTQLDLQNEEAEQMKQQSAIEKYFLPQKLALQQKELDSALNPSPMSNIDPVELAKLVIGSKPEFGPGSKPVTIEEILDMINSFSGGTEEYGYGAAAMPTSQKSAPVEGPQYGGELDMQALLNHPVLGPKMKEMMLKGLL